MKPNRDLGSLDPQYRQRFVDYLAALEAKFPQFNFIVTEAGRSDELQAHYYATGKSKVRRSNHQDGRSIDVAIYRHADKALDWRPAVYRNVYRQLDPREFGLTSGAHLWQWDEGHLQIVEAQGRGTDLSTKLESY